MAPSDPLRLSWIVAATRAERRAAVARWSGPDAQGLPRAWMLCASTTKQRAVRRSYWDQEGKPPTWWPRVEPWRAFVQRLASRWTEDRPLYDAAALERGALRLWTEHRSEFAGWAGLVPSPTICRALADLGTAIRLAGGLQVLLDGAETKEVDQAVLRDVERWAAWWDGFCDGPGRPWDDAAQLRAVAAVLAEAPPALKAQIAGPDAVIVDDLPAWTGLDVALLEALARLRAEVRPDAPFVVGFEASVLADDVADFAVGLEKGRDPEARRSRALRRRWAAWVDAGTVEAEVLVDDAAPAVDLVRAVRFDLRLPDDGGACVGPLRLRRYTNSRAEAAAAARACKAWILDGADPEQIILAVPALDAAVPLFRDAFASFGVPLRVEKGEDPRTHPWIAAARLLLAMAQGADARQWLSLCASPFFRVDEQREAAAQPLSALLPTHCPTPSPPWSAAQTMVELQRRSPIVGSLDDAARATVSAMVAELDPALSPPSVELATFVSSLQTLVDLERALRHFAQLRDRTEIVAAARELCHRWLWPPGAVPSRDTSGPASSEEKGIVEIFDTCLAAAARALDLGDAPFSSALAEQPVALLLSAVDELLPHAGRSGGAGGPAVRLAGLRDVRGLDPQHLWVAGLRDGQWPRTQPPNPLVPPSFVAILQPAEPTTEDRADLFSWLRNARTWGPGATLTLSFSGDDERAATAIVADLRALRCGERTLGRWMDDQQRHESESLDAQGPWSWDEVRGPLPDSAPFRDSAEAALAQWQSRRGEPGEHDGVLSGNALAAQWVAERLRVRAGKTLRWSVTGLEAWVLCPMRRLFGSLLGLAAEEPPGDEPNAMDGGTVLHGALEEFYKRRIERVQQGTLRTASLEGATEAELASARTELHAALLFSVAARRNLPKGPWAQAEFDRLGGGLSGGSSGGRLAAFLVAESRRRTGAAPALLEWQFPPIDARAEAFRIRGQAPRVLDPPVELNGRVDRVDLRADGGAIIWDYKSGALPDASGVADGRRVQPIVYLVAAWRDEAVGRRAPDASDFAAGYLGIGGGKRGGATFVAGAAAHERLSAVGLISKRSKKSAPLPASGLADALLLADHHVRLALSGWFAPTPFSAAEAHCEHCEFRRACRVDPSRDYEPPAPDLEEAGLA